MKTKIDKEMNKLVILGKRELSRILQPRNGHTQKRIVIFQK